MKKVNSKEIILFFILIIISGILFFFDFRGWLKLIKAPLEKPVIFLEKQLYSWSRTVSPYLIIKRTGDFQKEILRLQIDQQKLAVDQNQLTGCLAENEQIRRLLGAPLPIKWKFLPAKVISLTDLMRLDQGEQEQVKVGQNVVSENILVGKIVFLEKNSSSVQLPISPQVKIPVIIRRPNISGVQGRGLLINETGKLLLDKVLQAEKIQAGDLVSTSGETDWLPDLLIGQIEEVKNNPAEIYQQAQIKPLLDYSKLRTVFIIIK